MDLARDTHKLTSIKDVNREESGSLTGPEQRRLKDFGSTGKAEEFMTFLTMMFGRRVVQEWICACIKGIQTIFWLDEECFLLKAVEGR